MNEPGKATLTSERDWKAYAIELENHCQQVEAELDQAKVEAGLLIQHAATAIYEIDLQRLCFKSVNDTMCQISGYSREELIGMNPFDLLDNAGKRLLQERMRKTLAGEPMDPGAEYKVYRKDGQVLYSELNSSILLKDGKPDTVFVIAHDVTERKLAEEALRESEERYKTFFENSIDAVLLTSPDGSTQAANPEACHIFGMTEEELIQAGREGIVDITDPCLIPALEERSRTGSFKGELRYRRKDGSVFPGEVSTAIYTDRDGKARTSMIIRDITARKRAEEALVKSEEKFAKAFRSSPLALAISTLDEGRFLEVNDSYICLLGFSREELVGYTSIELGLFPHPQERQEIARLIREEKGFRDYPIRLLAKGGNPRDLLFSAEAIEIDGQACLLSLITDITESKRAEEALKTSQQRLVDFLESTHDSFFALDRNWHFSYANQQFCDFMQRKSEELIGKNFWEEFPSYQGSPVEGYYQQVMEERRPVHFDMGGIYTNHWFEMSIYPTQDGISVFGVNRTGKHLAEEALRASEAREKARRAELEAIMDAAPAMIWISRDPECREMVGNLYGNQFLRMKADANISKTASEEDLLKQPYKNYREGKEIPSQELPMQMAASKGITTKDCELDIVFDDGEVKTVYGNVVPIWDEQGKPSGAVGVFLDITERKIMELALADANQLLDQKVKERTVELEHSTQELVSAASELERALQAEKQMRQQLIQSEKYAALNRLVASVAHEINNPLQTVQNSLYLLRNSVHEERALEFMQMAIAESNRISFLVQQLRETYRPAKSLQAVDFNLIELINSIYALTQPQFRQNTIEFQMHTEATEIRMNGVPDQLKQVFLNIFLNAVDAMGSQGGQIWLDITQPDQKQICVAIQDTGPGISPENVNKIFEPFFTTKEKGTGLGLAITYEIVKDHGGEITVESEPGEGATFKVYLPMRE